MYTLENLKFNRLYKKQFLLPFIKEDKKHGSAILLLTPNYESSLALMNNKFTINRANSFHSYYIERDIMYTINNESHCLEIDHNEYDKNGVILESNTFTESTDIKMYDDIISEDSGEITDLYIRSGNKVFFFNENYDENIINEANNVNAKYKRLLYNDRLRNNKSVFELYNRVKTDNPWIKKTFIRYDRYHGFNLFVDLYYYNQVYLSNNTFTIKKSVDMYFEFIKRFINDKRIRNAGYSKFTVFIPVNGWNIREGSNIFDFRRNLNPISVLFKKHRYEPTELEVFKDITFVFFGDNGYFKYDYDNIDKLPYAKFMRFIRSLSSNETIQDNTNDEEENSSDAIVADIVADIEDHSSIQIHNLTGNANNAKTLEDQNKADLVKKINKAAEVSRNKEDALDKLEEDEDVKRILADLQNDSDDNGVKISATRANRITNAQDSFTKKQLDGKSIKQMINEGNKPKELPEKALPIKSINKDWQHLKAINFEEDYDLDADILKLLYDLSDKDKHQFPIAILDVNKEDTSTSEDSIYTYTVKCEDYSGKRFTIKFDIPKFRNNRFMRLRGNEKIFSIEMPLLPISKTSDSTAQIVSFYNKIFIMRYNTSNGKSNPFSNKFIKAISKYNGNNIKVTNGDNSIICEKYDLPIDYIDLASVYSKITFHSKSVNDDVTIYFNQSEIRKIPGINTKNGIPVAMTSKGKVLYYNAKVDMTMSQFITSIIDDKEFIDLYNKQSPLRKATYSRAKVLNTYIPVIVILAHDLGLIKAMDLAGIKYSIETKIPKRVDVDYVALKDGYIIYNTTYDAMMLMNGLKDCNLEDVSITDINKKTTWIEQLENFGGRNKSDGLDNFKEMMYDPITVEVSRDYKLPTNYHDALIYASNLLVDNKYTKHIDISNNRYRTNEVVAAQFYRVLSTAYREYIGYHKRGKKQPLMIKQSAVIDMILQQNNTSDLSVFQPLLEVENRNSISTKGVTGLNEERSYTLDKRGYDESMINNIAISTGFASTVGVNRVTTIDPGITSGRGYFKQSDIEDGSITRTYSVTEALSPFSTARDDPYRGFMNYIQTAKHGTPIEKGLPQLVTTGAQEALPYLSSDMFAFKAKKDGKILEITDQYMLVEYKDGTRDYIDLSEQTKKNSDGGFYITLKLTTDKAVGKSFKAGEVLAWDNKSFSNKIGIKQLSYNIGSLVKVAILSSDDCFEDSGVCSEWLTETMASDIVLMKSVMLSAQTNVLSIIKKGASVKEGDPILIFQNAFDDEDANILLKNLSVEDGDITTIGRNVIKSKVTGTICDIKIYRTCELKDMSESLRSIVSKRENEIKKLKKIAGDNTEVQFDSVGKLKPIGKMKNAEDCVLIEIYMKYHDKMSVGDKIVNSASNKNILMNIYKDDDAPYTDFRPNEQIDIIGSASSIDGRIITSPFYNGSLNKLMIELQRKCCEIYGKEPMMIHEIYDYYFGK